MKKIFFIALSLILVQNILFAAEPLKTETPETAANFTLLDLNNKEFSLSEFKGKPVILFFWTTWCPYCRKELKELNSMQSELLKDGIQVAAINVDEPLDKVRKFFGNTPFSYRVLLDTDTKVADAYGILGVPTYFLINKDGRIVFANHYFPEKEYKDLILK